MQDLNDKVTGGNLTADEWNEVPSEIQNVIANAGIALSGGDLSQLLKAIYFATRTGSFGVDSGAADAYIVTSSGEANVSYSDGMIVVFDASAINTGNSTIDLDGLGVKNIKAVYGSTEDLIANQISGLTTLIYDGTNFCLYSPNLLLQNDVALSSVDSSGSNILELIKLNSISRPQIGNSGVQVDILGGSKIQLLVGATKKNAITANETGEVELFFGNSRKMMTQSETVPAALSSVIVKDATSVERSVGFNEMPPNITTVDDVLDKQHSGHQMHYTGTGSHNFSLDTDVLLPIGVTWTVFNRGTGNLNITENGSTIRFMDGAGVTTTGDRVLAIAGVATITKYAAGAYMIFGAGLT